MLQVKALGPCTLLGFRTLLRGETCDVPEERREHAERLRKVGCLEFLEVAPVVAEPSGNEAPAGAADTNSSTPAALSPEEAEAAELAKLEAELAELDGEPKIPAPTPAPQPKPARAVVPCKFCGKAYVDHAQGKPTEGLDPTATCGDFKKLFKPASKPAAE